MKTLKNVAFVQDVVHLHSLGPFLVEYSSDFDGNMTFESGQT